MFKIWTYDTQHNDIQPNDTQHNGTQYCHAECICRVSFMLSVVTIPIMLLLSVIMLSVVVPKIGLVESLHSLAPSMRGCVWNAQMSLVDIGLLSKFETLDVSIAQFIVFNTLLCTNTKI